MLVHILTLAVLGVAVAARAEYVCQSVEVRSFSDFQLLRNCTHVVGHVRIVNMRVSAAEEAQLSTAVEEITDYLLVHRVQGLRSLQSVFPHLTLIRGYGEGGLLFDEYALAVYENFDLLKLGLVSLLRIQSGSVRIESNPLLCYVETVNWVYLLSNTTKQHLILKNNQQSSHCTLCKPTADNLEEEYIVRHCWDWDVNQRPRPNSSSFNKCPTECEFVGCDPSGECCSNNCLSGCLARDCKLCGTLKQGRNCVDFCKIPYYEFRKSKCIFGSECRKYGMILHAGHCVEKCPPHHYQMDDKYGQPSCIPLCNGNIVIHTADDLEGLELCDSIKGSVSIELTDMNSTIVTDLENSLGRIKEITGFLRITRSPQLMSLSFLRKLDTIRGDVLIDHKYALYVVDNFYLEQIWMPNQRVGILKGKIFFHLNPRLCHEHILELESSLRSVEQISVRDVSSNSNGERVICGDAVRLLNVTIEDFNSNAVRIKLDPLVADDMDLLLGYIYYYKEAPKKNVSMYDGRHGCGHDHWRMDIRANRNVRYIIKNLKPFTQYAVFVKMLTRTEYHRQLAAFSKVHYFRTLPSAPNRVAKVYYHVLSPAEMMIHWWPPHNRNGIIERYIISVDKVLPQTINKSTVGSKDPKASTTVITDPLGELDRNSAIHNSSEDRCKCSNVDPFLSGPPPEDETYYSRDQLIYEEALPDVLFYAPPLENRDEEQENNTTMEIEENEIESEEIGLAKLQSYHLFLEQKAIAEQDTNTTDYPIPMPEPLCSPNVSFTENENTACQEPQNIHGVVVPGETHSYTIRNLEPKVTYRISVRACVENVTNGCGPAKTILAETVSESLENFFKGFLRH